MILSKYFKSDNIRSNKLRRNIIVSVFLQGITMLISLILFPISLRFVSIEQYGVWLTISSILLWFSYFDLGLGTGLKNKLSESLAKEDYALSRKYISTAYAVLILIMAGVGLFYFILSGYIDWVKLFNLNEKFETLIKSTINLVIYLFLARFVLQLVNSILDSLQLLYVAKIFNVISQFLILVSIYLLSQYTKGDIFILGFIFSLTPIIVFLVGSVIVFLKYNNISPTIKSVDFSLTRSLYSLGIKFFLIQISMLVLFQTSSILIINFFGPESVVQYNVAYNLFAMINVGFSTIAAPYWTAYTNAWVKGDIPWIKKTNANLIKIWAAIVFFALIVLIFSEQIYFFWLKKDLNIPFKLSMAMYVYFSLFSFCYIYNMFINGVGKIQLQIISLGISAILYIPILVLFTKVFNWGLVSFPLALLTINFYSLIIAPIQYKKLINGTARGLFNK